MKPVDENQSYLKSLSEGSGSVILQSVSSSNKHLQAEGRSRSAGFFMVVDQ